MQTTAQLSRRNQALGLGISLVLTLSACGGGGSTASNSPSTSDPTSSQTSDASIGAISGFGSVIVNGVRYDDSAASVSDDSGNSVSSSSLALGMTVEIKGKTNDDATGTASSLSLFSEAQGPIAGLDANAGTFKVLGLTVSTSASTIFANVAGVAALSNGNVVEVHGLRSGTTVAATRVELKTPAAGDAVIKFRGLVSGLNLASNSFTTGDYTINYAAANVTPAVSALADGVLVKIQSTSAPTGSTINASRVHVTHAKGPRLSDGTAKAEIQGLVSNFVSLASFKVGEIEINASNATFLRGVAIAIANGVRVEVKGTVVNGVLVARLVKFDDASGTDGFRLHGAISNFVSASNFVVRGVKIDASSSTLLFERGTVADLANGRNIEVEGSMDNSTSTPVLKASKIKFEDGSSSSTSEVEFKGKITAVTATTVTVGTRVITITSATVFRRITQAQLVVGALLEVKGRTQTDGSILAVRISLED